MWVCYNWINVNFVILGLKKEAWWLSGGRGCLRSCLGGKMEVHEGRGRFITHYFLLMLCIENCVFVSSAPFYCGFRIFLRAYLQWQVSCLQTLLQRSYRTQKNRKERKWWSPCVQKNTNTHSKNVKQHTGFVTADISVVTLLRPFPSVHVFRIKWVRNLHLPNTPNEKKTLETHLQWEEKVVCYSHMLLFLHVALLLEFLSLFASASAAFNSADLDSVASMTCA